jgi:hypothetical protein
MCSCRRPIGPAFAFMCCTGTVTMYCHRLFVAVVADCILPVICEASTNQDPAKGKVQTR